MGARARRRCVVGPTCIALHGLRADRTQYRRGAHLRSNKDPDRGQLIDSGEL
jgi:hypothetical protein